MDLLPQELLDLILLHRIRACQGEKNAILPLRLVNKRFDIVLRPLVFKTVQLEFSKFHRHIPTPALHDLEMVGDLCQAIYLNMMVIRDEEEITRLSDVFSGIIQKVPEMEPLLSSLRRYCMNDSTFDETDFKSVLDGVLKRVPNLTRLRVNLPFQVVGRQCQTATLLLATTFECIALRSQQSIVGNEEHTVEYKKLDTLVLDHVTDTSVISICHNPRDLHNTISVFEGLGDLIISIKRQESRVSRQDAFARHLWFLTRKATELVSLCLVGWNVKRDIKTRRHRQSASLNEWSMRCLPYVSCPSMGLKHLRFLELKRLDIDPRSLLAIVEENCASLKELYLIEVYIKVTGSVELMDTSLWIGHPNIIRPHGCCWVAEELRLIDGLNLNILRVTGLGYDDFDPDTASTYPDYDLPDSSGNNISFDQRFVEAVFRNPKLDLAALTPPARQDLPGITALLSNASDAIATPVAEEAVASDPGQPVNDDVNTLPESTSLPPLRYHAPPAAYDAVTSQLDHNTTSTYKTCLDGYFYNHNEQALRELQRIIDIADKGMDLISTEFDRTHAAQLNPDDGTLAIP
ncbi:hypothetical protein BJ878DRAFT_543957 [Calycina marina]|uniref:MADS-box domain-containing protein n=1 Tax=Calycina marina TaxID=1763456 RepID=A0A9P8CDH6_9HELO|nr:hypothetical protein BJ878DRAFT_543957 [Calycina marina]